MTLRQRTTYPNGVNGFSKAQTSKTSLSQELDDNLEVISHRGPDSRGQWISKEKHVGIIHIPSIKMKFMNTIADDHSSSWTRSSVNQ